MKQCRVSFVRQDKSITVPAGTDLLTAAVRCGLPVTSPCGGEGICGKCRMMIKSGKVRVEESRHLSSEDRKAGMVLACQSIVEDDIAVDIPDGSLEVKAKVSTEAEEFAKGVVLKREGIFKYSPLVRKLYLEIPPPTTDDNLSDLDRIVRALEEHIEVVNISSSVAGVKHISDVLRDSDFRVTVTIACKDDHLEILSIEPGDTSSNNYGFAFDIGTTTVAGQLLDMNSKEPLGGMISFNRQAAYGSDVITRIIYAQSADGLDNLSSTVVDNINDIVEHLCAASSVRASDVNSFMFAGNMTMMHLLLGIDPSNIRRAPYIPAATSFPAIHPSELGIKANPKGLCSFLPGVSSYIGGDIVSGVLACGLHEAEELTILIDIGTNGEVVLGNREWMMGAAASAGPAFEGSGLKCGMKAVKGAVQKVAIDENLDVNASTIDSSPARGICGSGYIDLLCQMLKRKVIGRNGKIDPTLKSGRIRKTGTGLEFVVVFADKSEGGRDIVIDEDDIDNLKRSKAAIYSAIIALLRKIDTDVSGVKKIYIAGGFGNYLNIENSVFIGLLPDTDRGVYEFIGNSSLAGARMSLLSHEAYTKAFDIHKGITYVDLSGEPNYMDEYVASLFFPHTDTGAFPSVRL